ncbi:hypothetical protein P5P81_05190 [Tritonibacter mobilis]|nr:hypothetical protein [Tritonibacter mobilis]
MHLHVIRPLAAAVMALDFLTAPVAAQSANEALPHQHLSVSTTNLIERLQGGGHVLIVRHERTNAFIPDSMDFELGDCAAQRNLSVAGHANAMENGIVGRHLKIPIGTVLASPVCRTLETARLMFGSVEPEPDLWGYNQDPAKVRADFRQLVVDGAGQPKNTALVTHLGTYSVAFGGHLAEGDTAVFTVVDNEPEFLGVIAANAWNDAIIDATVKSQPTAHQAHDDN